jgi:hypothetical protein
MLTTLALTVALAGPPHPVNPPAPGPIARHIEQTVFAKTPRAVEAPFAQAGSRDSLKNGAVTGAVIGGLATGVFIGYLCHVFNDNDMNCWAPAALWAGIGAGAGALAGAGIDALFQRRVGVRVPIKF